MSVRITERFDGALAGCRVDEEAGVIFGAVLCGFTSANGRDYPRAVLEAAAPKYAGAKIHLNHAKDGRTIQDWIGVVESPTSGSDGRPRGRLEMFKSDPFVPKLLEAARRYPNKFGLSHVAMANTRRQNGREVVESIERIESVDFVTDPATVKGLFESVQQGGRAVANRATATRVIEDVMAGHLTWSAFIEGQITEDDMLAKLKKLAKGHRDAGGSGDDSGAPSIESRQVPTGAAFAESLRSGYVPSGRVPTGRAFAESLRHGCVVTEASHAAFLRSIRS